MASVKFQDKRIEPLVFPAVFKSFKTCVVTQENGVTQIQYSCWGSEMYKIWAPSNTVAVFRIHLK